MAALIRVMLSMRSRDCFRECNAQCDESRLLQSVMLSMMYRGCLYWKKENSPTADKSRLAPDIVQFVATIAYGAAFSKFE